MVGFPKIKFPYSEINVIEKCDGYLCTLSHSVILSQYNLFWDYCCTKKLVAGILILLS